MKLGRFARSEARKMQARRQFSWRMHQIGLMIGKARRDPQHPFCEAIREVARIAGPRSVSESFMREFGGLDEAADQMRDDPRWAANRCDDLRVPAGALSRGIGGGIGSSRSGGVGEASGRNINSGRNNFGGDACSVAQRQLTPTEAAVRSATTKQLIEELAARAARRSANPMHESRLAGPRI